MKKIGKGFLIIMLVNLIVSAGLGIHYAGPVMDENNISALDLVFSSESRKVFKDEIIKANNEKAFDIASNFFGYLIDEISVDPNAKAFEGYSDDAFDFDALIREKEEMDKLYELQHTSNP